MGEVAVVPVGVVVVVPVGVVVVVVAVAVAAAAAGIAAEAAAAAAVAVAPAGVAAGAAVAAYQCTSNNDMGDPFSVLHSKALCDGFPLGHRHVGAENEGVRLVHEASDAKVHTVYAGTGSSCFGKSRVCWG